MLSEQVALAKISGDIYDAFGAEVLFLVKSAHSNLHTDLFCWCTLNVQQYSVFCSLRQQTWLRHSPTMREEYLWKGSKGHFPFPSSCFPSSLSCPLANVCQKQKERERKEKLVKLKKKCTILFRHSTGIQGWNYRMLPVHGFSPVTTTSYNYHSQYSEVQKRYIQVFRLTSNLQLSHGFIFLSKW